MWRQRVQATLSRGLGEVRRRVAKDSPGSSTETLSVLYWLQMRSPERGQ